MENKRIFHPYDFNLSLFFASMCGNLEEVKKFLNFGASVIYLDITNIP